MSKRQEKQTPLELLEHKLRHLGFENDPASKNLLNSLSKQNVPGEVVDDVNNMISIAVRETQKKAKKAILELAEKLQPNS